ncbi:MAG: cupin domain-containing protein, partial [Dehalococcoidia bacterium]|nr:cupin domain-containing protein [Dehalococcoidia bacterium]
KGHGRFVVGDNLETELAIGPGDFIYVPAEATHQPINDGSEDMEIIVARNTPVEIVVEVDPSKA